MSNATRRITSNEQHKSGELSSSDVFIGFLLIFCFSSIIYSMFMYSSISKIIMDKNLSDFERQASESYFYFMVIGYALLVFLTLFVDFKSKGAKSMAFITITAPMIVFIIIETLVITNQIAITHFRAPSLYPSQANLALFSDVIKGIPNSSFELYSTLTKFSSVSAEGCKDLSYFIPRNSVYVTSFKELCLNNYSPSKAIFKYMYYASLGITSVLLLAYLSISKHFDILSGTANK